MKMLWLLFTAHFGRVLPPNGFVVHVKRLAIVRPHQQNSRLRISFGADWISAIINEHDGMENFFFYRRKYLVWSFNHVQMQMYAILKLILKEFIKVNCSAENNVLCSYFIKTFLFWKFEGTDKHFWRTENFRTCLKYLLTEFHYFIPSFNLLEVKLTQHAQLELLQLWDIVTQYDIKIIEQCRTLKQVWREFANITDNSVITHSCALQNNWRLSDMSKKIFYQKHQLHNSRNSKSIYMSVCANRP